MSQMISYNGELIRINGNTIQYSKTNGGSWYTRFTAHSSFGVLQSLMASSGELLMNTSTGLYYSKNGGQSWYRRS